MILHSVFLEGAPWFLLELLQWLWTFPFWYSPRNKSPFFRGTGQASLCMTGLKAWIENLGPGESSILKKTWMIYLHIVNLQRIQSISAKTVFPQRSQLYRDIFWSREGIITVLWGKLFFYISLFQRGKKAPHHLWRAEGIRSLMRLNWYMNGCGCQVIISQQNGIAFKVTSVTYYQGE